MAPKDSRYMLPFMPSHAFLRSASKLSLQSERQAYADFDFGCESSARPATSHKAFSMYSVPDLSATALPPMHPQRDTPSVPQIPQKYGGSAPVTINPSSTRRYIRRPPPTPNKSAKSGKGSTWGRWKLKVKTAFRIGRKKQLQIGGPTDFEHKSTRGNGQLREPITGVFTLPASGTRVPGGAGGTGLTMSNRLDSGNLGNRPNTDHITGTDSASAGTGGEKVHGGLGHQDTDGTAASDDGDSDWEDEATRILRGWDENQVGKV